jgi:hypothetical protein
MQLRGNMAIRPRRGDNVTLHYEKNGEEWEKHGTFFHEDDEDITITGTIGEDIGRRMTFPRTRVIYFEWTPKRDEEIDESWT